MTPTAIIEAAAARLAALLGPGGVHAAPALDVAGVRPGLEVFPADRDQLAAVLAVAGELGLSVCPAGGGTKLGWGAAPRSCDILLRTVPRAPASPSGGPGTPAPVPAAPDGPLYAVIEYDPENLTLKAGVGARVADLQALVAADGLMLPLDPPLPGAATLGGVVATNDHGPRRLRHGSLRDVVLGIEAVLAGGERIKAGGRTIKNVTGYDLTRLFVGSFGSLGVLSAITVRLLPRPECEALAVVALPDMETAFRLMEPIWASQLEPAALALISPGLRGLLPERTADLLAAPEGMLALVVAAEGHPAAVGRHLREIAGFAGSPPTRVIDAPTEVQTVWSGLAETRGLARRAGYGLEIKVTTSLSGTRPLLEAFDTESRAVWLADLGCGTAAVWLRPGDGPAGGPDAEGPADTRSAGASAASPAVDLTADPAREPAADGLVPLLTSLRACAVRGGGSLVIVRDDPCSAQGFDPWGGPPDGLDLMRRLKGRFDPAGLLNPGRNVGGI